MKYIVKFEFMNDYGEWKEDYFSNNEKGLTIREAEAIADQLKREYIRFVRIEEFTK